MKTALLAAGIVSLLFTLMPLARAQEFSESQETYPRKGKKDLYIPNERPRVHSSGVIPEVRRKGLILLSPFAPARYGNGKNFVVANPFPGRNAQDSANEGRTINGGISFFRI